MLQEQECRRDASSRAEGADSTSGTARHAQMKGGRDIKRNEERRIRRAWRYEGSHVASDLWPPDYKCRSEAQRLCILVVAGTAGTGNRPVGEKVTAAQGRVPPLAKALRNAATWRRRLSGCGCSVGGTGPRRARLMRGEATALRNPTRASRCLHTPLIRSGFMGSCSGLMGCGGGPGHCYHAGAPPCRRRRCLRRHRLPAPPRAHPRPSRSRRH
jgi:hypothetical protein